MTGFFGGPNPQGGSVESRALRQIDSGTKSFANKDFVKNIAWLNQSVDTLSAYTQKLQKGVDDANQNAIEQIMGFAADLFIIFGGGEPTGIEIGDLKYVIQGIGALLGINPETPFPLNLFDAAWNMFGNYVVPLEQFTDVIFDAIMAWAEDFGLSPELIDSLQDLKDAIEALGTTFSDFFNSIHDLLEVFGTNFPVLGEFWDALVDLLTGVDFSALKPVIALLADLGIPFIQALTAIVNAGNAFLSPFSLISAGQIATLGDNVMPPASNNTTIWTVGIDSTNTWVYDETEEAFSTLGTGVAKAVVTQNFSPCNPGQKFVTSAKLKWNSIPSTANDFGYQFIWYLGQTEVSRTTINIASGHGSSSPVFVQGANSTITVPNNVDNFKVAAFVGSSITSGQVWIKDISVQLSGTMSMSLIDGLLGALENLLPFSFFDDLLGIEGANPLQIFDWFTNLLTTNSPINAIQIIGQLLPFQLPNLPISHLSGTDHPNLLLNPGFQGFVSITGDVDKFIYDETVGRTNLGCAKAIVDGTEKAIRSNTISVSPGQDMSFSYWAKWEGLVSTGAPILLGVRWLLNGNQVSTATLNSIATPGSSSSTFAGNESGWVKLAGTIEVPAGVDAVELRLIVTETATAGDIWFDDAVVSKDGLIQQNWIKDLLGDLGFLNGWIQDFIDSVLSGVGFDPGGTVGDIFDAISELFDTALDGQSWGASALDSINDIFDQFGGGLTQMGNVLSGMLSLFNLSSIGDLVGINVTQGWTGIISNLVQPLGLLATLSGGKLPDSQAPPIVATLMTAINQIGDILTGVIVDPIIGAVGKVFDFFKGLVGFQDKVIQQNIVQQNFTITAAARNYRNPSYVSKYPVAAVSYPQILNAEWSVFNDSGPATAGTAHTHDEGSYIAQQAFWNLAVNESYGSIVTIPETCIMDTIGVTIFANNAANNIFFEIFQRMNNSLRWDRVVSTDLSPHITSSSKTLDLTFTDYKRIVKEGDLYMMRIVNKSSPDSDVYIKGMSWITGTPDIGVASTTLTETNKTSYTAAEFQAMVDKGGIIPWVMFAAQEQDPPQNRTWADNFDQRTELGPLWFLIPFASNTQKLSVSNGRLSFTGTTDSTQGIIHIHTSGSDACRVDADLSSVNSLTAGVRLGMHGTATYDNAVNLYVEADRAAIETVIAGTSTFRASVNRTGNDGTWSIYYEPTPKRYTVLLNGQPIGLTWTDSTNLVVHGEDYRYASVVITRAGGVNGGQVDNWMLRDWTP